MKTAKQSIDLEYKGTKKRLNLRTALISLCMFAFVGTSAQTGTVTVKLRNASVKELFSAIEKQTSYRFSYRDAEIKGKGNVTISATNRELKQLLEGELSKLGLKYAVSGNKIIVTPAAVAPSAQPKKVTGKVVDANGEPVIGATVIEDGTSNGTVTDFDGNFTLNIPEGKFLTISYIGYKSQNMKAVSNKIMNIVLKEDSGLLDEVVVVGYGTQRKGNLTGSIANVKSDKLTTAPVSNVTNMLAGQLPGLTVKQTSGIPGSDGSSLKIRGYADDPLVIVDGVEGDLNNIDPTQIESITILKDGAASIYGARAGNGVILVTTKRGVDSKPIITLNTSYTLQGATKMAKPGSSGQRAEWDREAHLNAGLPESQVPYTEEQIQKFYEGTDPDYLNTDWFDAVIRKWAPQQNHNLSIRGGSDKIKYFGYAGFNKQETIMKTNGGDYTRFNVQSNVDAKVTDQISLTLDMMYTKEEQYLTGVGEGLGHYLLWEQLYKAEPRYPVSLPDPTKMSYAGIPYGNPLFATNTELGGYRSTDKDYFRITGALTYDVKQVKGLKLKALLHYNRYVQNFKQFRKQGDFYVYNSESGEYSLFRKSQDPTSLALSAQFKFDLTQQYSIYYENLFNEKHRVTALGLFESINYGDKYFETKRSDFMTSVLDQIFAGNPSTAQNSGWEDEMGRVSWVARLNYGYKDKYLIETIFRADASAKFPKGKRWGYFPSVSLGWVMSEEDFIKKLNFVDLLKFRFSYGQSGNDNVGSFKYLAGYAFDGSYIIGSNIMSGLYSTGLANYLLTWEKMSIYNGGVDFSLFNRKLYGTIEGFYRLRDGIPGNRASSLPSSFGAELPQENLNSIDTRGFEFTIGTAGKIGELSYDVSGNIAWSRSKWVNYDEPEYTDPDQERLYKLTGNWIDRRIGYVSDGLFTSMEEIEQLDYVYKDLNGNSTLRPGDVKYKDLNGDKVLDWRDQTEIGSGTMPHWTYGVNATFQYKGFDLSFLLQGAFDYTTYIDLETAPSVLKFENRWTIEENDPNSLVPRPGGASTNGLYSDYRNHNTSYLRLKNFTFGYEFPKLWLSKLGVERLRVYFAGTNLFTLSSLNKYGVDPEMPEGTPAYYYPQQRTLSFGLNLSF